MNIYTCNRFTGFYPVGVSAAVIATKPFIAARLLNKELKDKSLPGDAQAKDMIFLAEVQEPLRTSERVRILQDGDY